MKNKKKKINYWKVILLLSFYLVLVGIGLVLGMFYQQIIFYEGLGRALSYTNIQINFNETKFVQEFSQELNNTFIPAFKEAINQTRYNQSIK